METKNRFQTINEQQEKADALRRSNLKAMAELHNTPIRSHEKLGKVFGLICVLVAIVIVSLLMHH